MLHSVLRPAGHPRDAGHHSLWIGGFSISQGSLSRESVYAGAAFPPKATITTGRTASDRSAHFHVCSITLSRSRGPVGGGLWWLPACWAASWRSFRYSLVCSPPPPTLCRSLKGEAARRRQPRPDPRAWVAVLEKQILLGPAELLCLGPLPSRRRAEWVWAAPWCLWSVPMAPAPALGQGFCVTLGGLAPSRGLHPLPLSPRSRPEHWEVWGQPQPRSSGAPSPRCPGSRAAHPSPS